MVNIMDTLVVFCALVFSAFMMSLGWTAIYCLLTFRSRKRHARHEKRFATLAIDPFEPVNTTDLHFDPRMTQRMRGLPSPNVATATRPALPARASAQRLSGNAAPRQSDRNLPTPIVYPRRPRLPSGIVTARPKPLLLAG